MINMEMDWERNDTADDPVSSRQKGRESRQVHADYSGLFEMLHNSIIIPSTRLIC